MKLNLKKRLSDWLKKLKGKEKQEESKKPVFLAEETTISDSPQIRSRNSLRISKNTMPRFPKRSVSLRRHRHKSRDPLKNTSRKIMRGAPPKTAFEKRLWNPGASLGED